jgi:prepilin-type N-terminal cleavage/methylation domain-containing protein
MAASYVDPMLITRPPGHQCGFTLVEIAIVLVIIGLLIGGVLKGQEMILNAKLKKIERDHSGVSTAILSYQDRYRQLPGDDNQASVRFAMYTDGDNDPAPVDIDGNNDGVIEGDWVAAANSETSNLWKHSRASGLIPGNGDDAIQLRNTYGGLIGVRDGSLLISGHVTIFGSIEGSIIKIFESRIDDGSPASGHIQSDVSEALMDGNAASSAGATYLDSARYFMAIGL